MILMGDEVRRTQERQQQRLLPGQRDQLVRLVAPGQACRCPPLREPSRREAIAARRGARASAREPEPFSRDAKKAWHGVKLNEPDWGDRSHSLALGAELRREGLRFHFILNAFWEPLEFELPGLVKEPVATMDRHGTRLAARHRPVADGTDGLRQLLSSRSPLGRDSVRGRSIRGESFNLSRDTHTGQACAGSSTLRAKMAVRPAVRRLSGFEVAKRCNVRAMTPVQPV